MIAKRQLLLVVVCLGLLLAGCGRLPTEAETPTAVPTIAATPTQTVTPQPTHTPTMTPTPGPLDGDQALALVAPSLALLQTPLNRGTAVLLDNGYLVTNAETVWPFPAVRVLLSNGEELLDVPVAHWDMMTNLALLGPVETGLPALSLANGERLDEGRNVFLVAYPRGADDSAELWVSEGELRGLQEWAPAELTFLETNAHSSADQRGGVLLSDEGEVIGIAGYHERGAGFGLVLSAADVAPRLQALLDGHELNDLGGRGIPAGDEVRDSYTIILNNRFDQGVYLFNEAMGTEIELETSAEEDGVGFRVLDGRGDSLMAATGSDQESGSDTAVTAVDGLHVVEVFQAEDGRNTFHLNSNIELTQFDDPDNGAPVSVGRSYSGNLDYPGDVDTFVLLLARTGTFHIEVESAVIDPLLSIDFEFSQAEDIVRDDNSGGGLFELDAEMTYHSPDGGELFITVQSRSGTEIGGYFITLDAPAQADPTPMGPAPEPTPIVTDFGQMSLYESDEHQFTMQYPNDYVELVDGTAFCGPEATACFANWLERSILLILEEDMADYGMANITLEGYLELLIPILEENSPFTVSGQIGLRTAEGLGCVVLFFSDETNELAAARLVCLNGSVAFNALYLTPAEAYEALEEEIFYTFETLTVD
jgi:S1-C subfamily serine protease